MNIVAAGKTTRVFIFNFVLVIIQCYARRVLINDRTSTYFCCCRKGRGSKTSLIELIFPSWT